MFVGLPGLAPVPWWQALAIFGYAMVSCLVVNEAVKVALIKWRMPSALVKTSADLTHHKAPSANEPARTN
jgi:hypothetical protein